MRRLIYLMAGGLWLQGSCVQAEPGFLTLRLADVEEQTLKNSPQFQAVQLDYTSARSHADAQHAQLFPKLSLEGSFRNVSEVPRLQVNPSAPAIQFGDHDNYSYGPMLSWTVFTSGTLYNRYRSLDAAAKSKYFEWESLRRQLLLEARLTYFQVQLALEQVRLVADSLKLADSQVRDIRLQRRAGMASRIDELSSHQQMLARARDLRQAQGELANALRNLIALTGQTPPMDLTLPSDSQLKDVRLPEAEAPTALLKVDGVGSSESHLHSALTREPDIHHPNLIGLTEAARSSRLWAASLQGGHGPSVLVTAKTSRDYPNGPILESIHQNTIGVTASWPLFEAGRVTKETAAQTDAALSMEKRRDQAQINLRRDWDKAQDTLRSLRFQEAISQRLVGETNSVAKLVYESYRAGRSSYLDVDAANLRRLESNVVAARVQVQILMQLAILDSLSVPIEK